MDSFSSGTLQKYIATLFDFVSFLLLQEPLFCVCLTIACDRLYCNVNSASRSLTILTAAGLSYSSHRATIDVYIFSQMRVCMVLLPASYNILYRYGRLLFSIYASRFQVETPPKILMIAKLKAKMLDQLRQLLLWPFILFFSKYISLLNE